MIWLTFIASQIADVWTTLRFLKRGVAEANPAIRWLMQRFGRGWIAVKIGIASAGASVLSLAAGDVGVLIVALVFFGIAARNYRLGKRLEVRK